MFKIWISYLGFRDSNKTFWAIRTSSWWTVTFSQRFRATSICWWRISCGWIGCRWIGCRWIRITRMFSRTFEIRIFFVLKFLSFWTLFWFWICTSVLTDRISLFANFTKKAFWGIATTNTWILLDRACCTCWAVDFTCFNVEIYLIGFERLQRCLFWLLETRLSCWWPSVDADADRNKWYFPIIIYHFK